MNAKLYFFNIQLTIRNSRNFIFKFPRRFKPYRVLPLVRAFRNLIANYPNNLNRTTARFGIGAHTKVVISAPQTTEIQTSRDSALASFTYSCWRYRRFRRWPDQKVNYVCGPLKMPSHEGGELRLQLAVLTWLFHRCVFFIVKKNGAAVCGKFSAMCVENSVQFGHLSPDGCFVIVDCLQPSRGEVDWSLISTCTNLIFLKMAPTFLLSQSNKA